MLDMEEMVMDVTVYKPGQLLWYPKIRHLDLIVKIVIFEEYADISCLECFKQGKVQQDSIYNFSLSRETDSLCDMQFYDKVNGLILSGY